MDITQIRQKYPQYDDMSDQALADAMHKKYYADIPRDQFYSKIGLDRSLMGTVQDTWQGIKQGVTSGFGDEIQSAVAGAVAATSPDITFKEGYNQALEGFRGDLKRAKQRSPIAETLGEVGGNITTAVGAANRLGTVLKPISNPIAKAGVAGGVQGGIYGFGTGEGSGEERLKNSLMVGSMGAAGGAALTYGLSLLGRSLYSGINKVAGKIDQATGAAPENVDPAMRKVIDKLRADFPDDNEFAAALNQAAQDGTLAEIGGQGGRIQRLARGAAQYPEGESVIAPILEKRAGGATGRIKKAVKDYLSPNTDFYGTIDDITNRGQAKAKNFYTKAYETDVNLSPELNTPELQSAIAKARAQYPSELADLADNNTKVLDYAKRVLDDDIERARRTGEGNFARSRTTIKKALLEEIDAQNPAYKQARGISGDYLSNTEALENGRDFLKLDADTIGRNFKKLGPAQQESFKAGMARAVRDIIDKSRDGTDITKRILGNEEVRNKLRSVMQQSEYDDFAKSVRAEEKIFKLQRFVLGNSTTTGKAIDAADMAPEAQEFITNVATNGIKGATVQQATKSIMKMFDGLNDRTAGQVAKILFEDDPVKKLELINRIKTAGNPTQGQKALQAFFQTNKAIQTARKAIPSSFEGFAGGAIAGTATNEPLKITVRPSDANLTTTQP